MSPWMVLHFSIYVILLFEVYEGSIVWKTSGFLVPAPLLTSHKEHWRFFGSWKLRQHRCAENISTGTEGLSMVVVTVIFANRPEEAIKVPKLSWMSKAGSSKLEC